MYTSRHSWHCLGCNDVHRGGGVAKCDSAHFSNLVKLCLHASRSMNLTGHEYHIHFTSFLVF